MMIIMKSLYIKPPNLFSPDYKNPWDGPVIISRVLTRVNEINIITACFNGY